MRLPSIRLALRKELTNLNDTTRTALSKRLWSQGSKACDQLFLSYLHPAAFTLTGGAANGMELRPYVLDVEENWINATSPTRWAAGDQRYVCSVRYGSDEEKDGANAKLLPVSSASRTPAIRGLFGPTFPFDRRVCGLRLPDTTTLSLRACTSPHDVEHLWLFVPSGALAHASDAALDKACATTYEHFGHPLPKGASISFSTLTKSRSHTCVLLLDKPVSGWTAFGA